MNTRACVALRHLAFEDLGSFDALLRSAGFHVHYVDAPLARAEEIEDIDADLLVVLGAPIGANDERDYPFLAHELRLIGKRMASRRPTLGICLGAQLMARALGARVAPAPRGEIGWLPLTLSEAGKQSALKHFDGAPVFHWHGDAFDLPPHAVSLAATPDCPHQAFALGENLLGLQFHPEVTAQGLESWYVGHYRALQSAALDVHDLRADAQRHAATLRANAARFLGDWLAQLDT